MADFIAFNEGKTELAANGLPATVYFFPSTRGVDAGTAFTAGQTLAGGTLGEITGTGYSRKSEAEPAPVSGLVTFAQKQWATGSATDWPAGVRSVVACTTADNTGKALCAWNLQAGGLPRDLNAANVTLNFTPSLQVG